MAARSDHWMHTGSMLDAIEEWATPDYWLMRETVGGVDGRIDGLLIPASFDAHVFKARRGGWTSKAAVIGVEVKSSRADFQRGIREGQFDRYAASTCLAGLYVATTRDVKTSEIPDGFGHLACFRNATQGDAFSNKASLVNRCACKRHPPYRDAELDHDLMWRLVFHSVKKARDAEIEARQRVRAAMERIGRIAEEKVVSVLRKSLENVD